MGIVVIKTLECVIEIFIHFGYQLIKDTKNKGRFFKSGPKKLYPRFHPGFKIGGREIFPPLGTDQIFSLRI